MILLLSAPKNAYIMQEDLLKNQQIRQTAKSTQDM